MRRRNVHIGIVGGGIGGMAAGLALHQRGIDVTIYEQAEEMREAGAGLMLWPNGSRVIRELGLLQPVIASSGATTHFAIRGRKGEKLLDLPLGHFDAPARCIRRADLLAILLGKFPPAQIKLNHRLVGVEASSAGARLQFADGAEAAHDAVIGADGIRSRVRAILLGDIAPIYRGYTIWRGVAPYDGAAVESGCNSETWGRGQRFGLLDTGLGRFTWYATANLPAGSAEDDAGRKAELLARFGHWHAPVADVIGRTPEAAILKNGAYDLPLLPCWGRGPITLLGDAAHPCTPNLGQGGCLALEDALTLAKCCATDAPIEEGLRRYETLRRKRTHHIQRRSRLLGGIGQWEDDVLLAARRWLTCALPRRWLDRGLSRVYAFQT